MNNIVDSDELFIIANNLESIAKSIRDIATIKRGPELLDKTYKELQSISSLICASRSDLSSTISSVKDLIEFRDKIKEEVKNKFVEIRGLKDTLRKYIGNHGIHTISTNECHECVTIYTSEDSEDTIGKILELVKEDVGDIKVQVKTVNIL